MKRKTALPELLSPAGSYEALLAAVDAGADAVYLGGKCFNARAYAHNFDDETLARAVAYAHLHGVKVYVTLNTLIYDRELPALLEYAKKLYETGVDALIVADLGVISLLRENLPKLELHASTQATVHSSLAADEMYSLGVSRVVLSRELSLENIEKTTAICKPEVEIFLHGALCVSHSGQCLFSSLVGGRSGNRGECAQPCRLPYNNSYPLSLRDLCLAEHIPALISSGVSSLKIEGRMKSAQYVYEVTKIYRALLDENRAATKGEMARLAAIFSRDGFTDKYFTAKTDEKMTGTRSESDKETSREIAALVFSERKLKIKAKCTIKANEKATLTLTANEKTACAEGEIPSPAETSPLSQESVKARLCKTGATLFALSPEDIDLCLDEGLNLSPSQLNGMRRDACELLLQKFTEAEEKELPPFAPKKRKSEKLFKRTALCFYKEQYETLSKTDFFDIIFLPLSEFICIDYASGVYLPPVIFENEIEKVKKLLKTAKDKGARYALVGNLSHYSLCEEFGLLPIADFRANITNSRTLSLLSTIGACNAVLSPELSLPQIRDIGKGLSVVYGRIPLMLLERCFAKENFGCKNCNSCSFSDRRGVKFPIIREFEHRNLLLNSSITYMGDKQNMLSQYKVKGEHFIFTTESKNECLFAVKAYESGKELAANIRRIPK